MRRSLRALVATSTVAAVAFGSLLTASAAQAADGTIVIWTDKDRAAAVQYLFPNGYKGVPVQVVVKAFEDIRAGVNTVTADAAPDVVIGAADWVGELAANGKIVKLNLADRAKAALEPGAVQAFNYRGGQYGVPVAIENIAMITNADLVPAAKQPKTFAELETLALALKKSGKATVPLAVQQGAGGDAYHMYPLFTGLGGYIFGKTANGSYNTKDIGVYSKAFQQNAALINKWNKEGLISSKVDNDIAKATFLAGKSPFYITGPWNLSDIKDATKSKVKRYRITPVPPIVAGQKPVPFIGAQGVMLTSFAKGHGVESAARSLVTEYMATEKAQYNLSAVNDRYPANKLAAARVTNAQLKAFGQAGIGGTPIPNIPQMNSVWGPLGSAWAASTSGSGAIPAQKSFAQAAAAIKKALAAG